MTYRTGELAREIVPNDEVSRIRGIIGTLEIQEDNEQEKHAGEFLPVYRLGMSPSTMNDGGLVAVEITPAAMRVENHGFAEQSTTSVAWDSEAVKAFHGLFTGPLGLALKALGYNSQTAIDSATNAELFAVNFPSLSELTTAANNGLHFTADAVVYGPLLEMNRDRTLGLARGEYSLGDREGNVGMPMLSYAVGVAMLSPEVVRYLQEGAKEAENNPNLASKGPVPWEQHDAWYAGRALMHFMLTTGKLFELARVVENPRGIEGVTPTPLEDLGYDLDIIINPSGQRSQDLGLAAASSVLKHITRLSEPGKQLQ